jgi:hypothetical protein
MSFGEAGESATTVKKTDEALECRPLRLQVYNKHPG